MFGFPIFDLETDGFLESVTKVHCLNILDRRTGKRLRFTDNEFYSDGTATPRDGTIADGLAYLHLSRAIGGQNIIKYDLPVLKKLFGWEPAPGTFIFDTRVASSVIWPNMADYDFSMLRKGKLPDEFRKQGLIGNHSLKAWGYRLEMHKGDFDPKDYGFTWADVPFMREMDDYCALDCEVTSAWVDKIASKGYSPECLELEMDVACIIAGQELRGFAFDMPAAERLYGTLAARKAELEGQLAAAFPPWEIDLPPFIPKRPNKKLGYQTGVPVFRKKTVVFNPGSRPQIADRLKALHDWTPTEFTDGGEAKVDETILGSLPYPEAKLLSEYLLVAKYAGQVGDGDKSWFKFYRNGRIHGQVNSNGAVTGRMTHHKPNIAQTPKVGSPYGEECRALFVATQRQLIDGKLVALVLVGCDAEGLELRMLAHFLARWDGGAYAHTVVDGKKEDKSDVHNVNMRGAGLNTRDNAKTFIYALLYGAGDYKLGTIVYEDFTDEQKAKFDSAYQGKSRDRALATLGKQRRAKLMTSLPAFAELTKKVKEAAKKRGSLKGLDGRNLHVRSEHSALNTLLQSGGAIVMKKALVLLHRAILADAELAGRVWFVANVHDEFQMETLPHLAEKLGRLAADCIRLAGEHFGLKCPLAGDFAIGRNWAETH